MPKRLPQGVLDARCYFQGTMDDVMAGLVDWLCLRGLGGRYQYLGGYVAGTTAAASACIGPDDPAGIVSGGTQGIVVPTGNALLWTHLLGHDRLA